MTRLFLQITAPACILLGMGCGPSEPPPQQPQQDHLTDEYGTDVGEYSHGDMAVIGEEELGPLKIKVVAKRIRNEGQDTPFDVMFTPAASAPRDVIAWVGMEDDPQTPKVELDSMGPGYFHEHLDLPEPWNNDWKLWLQFDHFLDGETTMGFTLESKLNQEAPAESY
ncbi:MAG: hypothetical protein JJU11_00330 [Candidatus Sumerlaeia bacterium]|nr:hypothetical protein [Candidatus Sumerlaeia bacterium]